MTQANSPPTLNLQLTAMQLTDNTSMGKFAISVYKLYCATEVDASSENQRERCQSVN